MKMFELFKRKKEKEQMIEDGDRHFDEVWNADFDTIWTFSDTNDFVIGMYSYFCRKSDCGVRTEVFSGAERVFFACLEIFHEVNNGGFEQFFYNANSDFIKEYEAAFHEIGADEAAVICKKAIDCFGKPIPAKKHERQVFLDRYTTDAISDFLQVCDREFLSCTDGIEPLLYQYAAKNKDRFTR